MNKKELLLYVDELNRLEAVFFEGLPKPLPAAAHSGNVGDALMGFYFLIAISHLARKDKKMVQVYFGMERADFLMKKLKEVARREVRKNWIVNRFFKERPEDVFSKETKDIRFTDSIYPRVVNLSGIYVNGISKGKLVDLVEGLLGICSGENIIEKSVMGDNRVHSGNKRISVELRVGRGGEDLMRINNTSKDRCIIMGDAFDVVIHSNYPVHFCVIWLDAESRCYELHPRINEDSEHMEGLGDEKLEGGELPSDSSERILVLPSNLSLLINTDRGVESCIVLTSPREFDFKEVDRIKKRIRKVAKVLNFCQGKGGFHYHHQKLEEEKMPPLGGGLELGVVRPARAWVKEISEQMHGFADEIHILSVPHAPLLR